MSSFSVFGRTVPVRYEELASNESGEYDTDTKEIKISSSLTGDELTITEVHELFHATWDRIGLDQARLAIEIEEVIVQNFATVVVENYQLTRRK